MLLAASNSLIRKKSSMTNTKGVKKQSLRIPKRDSTHVLALEQVHLIVKRCADEIRERGLNVVDIFKAVHIGENEEDIRELATYLQRESREECKDELKKHDINEVASAIKWSLRHSTSILVPYEYYEEFIRYEQGKCSFATFLCYLPKQNQDILCEVFGICAEVIAESHINNMSAQRIMKSLALCLMSDNEKGGKSFDSAYVEWMKCSNACIHLFLAYLREKMLSENNAEDVKASTEDLYSTSKSRSRKQSMVTFSKTEVTNIISETPSSRPVSVLRVTRQIPTTSEKQEPRRFTTLLPDVMGGLSRKTIIRTSTVMTVDEQKSAEQMWDAFQRDGIGALSDDYLKMYLSAKEKTQNSVHPKNLDGSSWTQFERKGFKSLHLDPPEFINDKADDDQKPTITDDTTKNKKMSKISEKDESDELDNGQEVQIITDDSDSIRQTVVWDEFTTSGFKDNADNLSNLSLPLEETLSDGDEKEKKEGNSDEKVNKKEENSDDLKRKKSRSGSVKKKLVKFRSLRRPQRTRSFEDPEKLREAFSMDNEEDWEDWDIISRTEDLPVTTHLSIETVDEIFPYVWMETTAEDQGNRWGDWVFIEPRKGLVNECEWVMIEEKAQVFSDGELKKSYTRRKMSVVSTFSIPWLLSKGKPRPTSKVSTAVSLASSKLPQPPGVLAMFDRAREDDNPNMPTTNYKFGHRRLTKKDISGPYPQEKPLAGRNVATHLSKTMHRGYTAEDGTVMRYEKYQYEQYDYEYSGDNEYQDGYYDEYQDGYYNEYQDGYYDEYQDGYYQDGYYYQDGHYDEYQDGYYGEYQTGDGYWDGENYYQQGYLNEGDYPEDFENANGIENS
ncbi:3879_t:CDS:2 [Acaulospora morrowiae]|uniref:3879_t:CDS:1 n=1 Tax=Acaulospora morrowiae TaxID=94023 RepID=A0A9N9FGR0_9GLOM|nr:3879_t:CDS:2 [Acaulospora morrowiae]